MERSYYSINKENKMIKHINVIDYQKSVRAGNRKIGHFMKLTSQTANKIFNTGEDSEFLNMEGITIKSRLI